MHPLTGAQDHSYPASANNKQARTTLNKPYSLDVDRRWQVMLGVGSVKGLWPDSCSQPDYYSAIARERRHGPDIHRRRDRADNRRAKSSRWPPVRAAVDGLSRLFVVTARALALASNLSLGLRGAGLKLLGTGGSSSATAPARSRPGAERRLPEPLLDPGGIGLCLLMVSAGFPKRAARAGPVSAPDSVGRRPRQEPKRLARRRRSR